MYITNEQGFRKLLSSLLNPTDCKTYKLLLIREKFTSRAYKRTSFYLYILIYIFFFGLFFIF